MVLIHTLCVCACVCVCVCVCVCLPVCVLQDGAPDEKQFHTLTYCNGAIYMLFGVELEDDEGKEGEIDDVTNDVSTSSLNELTYNTHTHANSD